MFLLAVDRGSATMVGILFTMMSAALDDHSDDIPGLLTAHVTARRRTPVRLGRPAADARGRAGR